MQSKVLLLHLELQTRKNKAGKKLKNYKTIAISN